MDINSIKSRIVDIGLARKNRFEILIPGFGESTFYATDCNLPEITINNTPFRDFPPMRKDAIDVTYNDLAVVFLVDAEYNIRKLLEQWYSEIVNLDDGTWSYRSDYVRDITVIFLDNKGHEKLKANFLGCYPISIGGIDKSFKATDELQELPVTFTYTHYNIVK